MFGKNGPNLPNIGKIQANLPNIGKMRFSRLTPLQACAGMPVELVPTKETK
jgi:hypothetical protein